MQAAVVSWFKGHFSDENGASLVEYALLLALIAVIAIGSLIFLGKSVNTTLHNTANAING